ncbi:MAG: NAD(P)/FAD-dependent oxidoreductase [Clostridia bacterium]|nr:NAD(P)/FAD-dependent oxidoreductase [Clostridia bacterium]
MKDTDKSVNIAVVGGGAAGLFAAVFAARSGANVTILERNDRVGKKLLATGNGRCNMTNIYASSKNYHGANHEFAEKVIRRFPAEDAIAFFSDLGILPRIEADGKVYPYSNQASSVLDVLRMELDRLGVDAICNFEVSGLEKINEKFKITSYAKDVLFADKVIFAVGGKAAPDLGSNGSGYEILRRLGHRVTPLFPALVQIRTDAEFVRGLKGIKHNCGVCASENGRPVLFENGEVLFTEYGLSGPPIFQISRRIGGGMARNKKMEVILDLMPEYSKQELVALVKKRIEQNSYKSLENFFVGVFNKRLGQQLIKACGIFPLSRMTSTLSDKEAENIAEKVKSWSFEARGTMSWNNAQVTAGGIHIGDVLPDTLESKLIKGLYIAGEILDVDGDCGGYNLQWAWASGYVAGMAASGEEA